jgi:hypothetical protein
VWARDAVAFADQLLFAESQRSDFRGQHGRYGPGAPRVIKLTKEWRASSAGLDLVKREHLNRGRKNIPPPTMPQGRYSLYQHLIIKNRITDLL